MKLAEIAEIYAAEQAGKRSRAWRSFQKQFLARWGDREITEINVREIRTWISEEKQAGRKEQTIHCKAGTLRQYFRIAEEEGVQCTFPRRVLRGIRINNERSRRLLPAEKERLKAVLQPSDWAICEIVLLTGLRTADLFHLRRDQVDLTHCVVSFTTCKTGRATRLPLSRKARKVFQSLMRTTISEYVVNPLDIQCADRKRLAEVWKRQVFRPALRAARVKDFRFHDLRHEFASQLAEKNVSLYKIQTLLDHSNPRMTQRYAHIADRELGKAVNLL